MRNIDAILSTRSNRYYPLPEAPWKYYQEWHDVVFMHWKFPPEEVAKMLPEGLTLDTYNGHAYLSFVAFTVSDLSYKSIPMPPYFSTFREINLRTYVIKNGIRGIYILSMETNKWPVALLSNLLMGMHYKTSSINRKRNRIKSHNVDLGFSAEFNYRIGEAQIDKIPLEYWLTERHCLYQKLGTKLLRLDIHHKEWQLRLMKSKIRDMQYHYKSFHTIGNPPVLQHFCRNIKVLFWKWKTVNDH